MAAANPAASSGHDDLPRLGFYRMAVAANAG